MTKACSLTNTKTMKDDSADGELTVKAPQPEHSSPLQFTSPLFVRTEVGRKKMERGHLFKYPFEAFKVYD